MNGGQRLLVAILMMVVAGLAMVGCGRAAQATYPTKPIEFVVHAAPGGGSDIFVRTMTDIIEKNKLLPVSISIVNKPGGSSSVAKAYLAEKAGDPYYWMTASSSFQTSAVRGQTKLGYKDFTPLAGFASDFFVVLVREDSRFKSFRDLIDEARKNPKKVNWAGSSVGNDDHILMYLVQKLAGVEFTYVSHQSGGEVMASLLGGHVDLASANPQEAAGQIEAKKVRLLAASSDQRIATLKDVPTLKEQGVDLVWTQFRGLVGSKDMPKDAVQYLDGLFKKVADTSEWKKYLRDNDLIEKFMASEEFGKFLAEDYQRYDEIMGSLGLKKK